MRPTAFLATCDAVRPRAFYEGVLGLAFVSEAAHALVMDAHGVALRIQKVDRLVPQPFTVLGWEVDDVAAAVARFAARGVEFERFAGLDQDELGVWSSPLGARVAWFRDPDGNTLSLTQPG